MARTKACARKGRKKACNAAPQAMHPRSRYGKGAPDFAALAKLYPELRQHTVELDNGFLRIDWKDPRALLAVTKTLLQHDFGIKFSMPENHLCPPVPQRLNYLHWVEELLEIAPYHSASLPVCGIDIGTGASCIFPLLGTAQFKWQFVATEVDSESIESARHNIQTNHLEADIELIQTTCDKVLLGVIPDGKKFSFCVCNPPFFKSLDETNLNPKRVCKATSQELTCPGGEVDFVGKIIQESVLLKDRIQWFTSMIGRKSSLKKLLEDVRALSPSCVRSTKFVQGKQTRWGIAWTFDEKVADSLRSQIAQK